MSSTAAALGEENGGRPARHSNSTTPREYRSVRPSTSGTPCACSGLMYSSVPTTNPLRVTRSSPELARSEEHTSELQSQSNLVCRLLLEKKKQHHIPKPAVTPSHTPGPPRP